MTSRPGALCTLLGLCSAAADCSVTDPAVGPGAGRFSLDLCTSTGTSRGQLPATFPGQLPGSFQGLPPGISNGQLPGSFSNAGAPLKPPLCRSNADCVGGGRGRGAVCVFSGGECASKTCGAETGMAVCEAVGSCSDPCAAPAVLARVRESRARAPPCKGVSGAWGSWELRP